MCLLLKQVTLTSNKILKNITSCRDGKRVKIGKKGWDVSTKLAFQYTTAPVPFSLYKTLYFGKRCLEKVVY